MENSYILFYKAYRYYEKNQIEKSLYYIKKSLSIKPNYSHSIDLLKTIGIFLNDKEIVNEAIKLFISKKRIRQEELLSISSGYVFLEKYNRASEYLKRVTGKKYRNKIIKIEANIASNKGNYEEALNILKEIGPLENNDDPYLLCEIGTYFLKIGKSQDAIEYLNKAKEKGKKIINDYVNQLIEENY